MKEEQKNNIEGIQNSPMEVNDQELDNVSGGGMRPEPLTGLCIKCGRRVCSYASIGGICDMCRAKETSEA